MGACARCHPQGRTPRCCCPWRGALGAAWGESGWAGGTPPRPQGAGAALPPHSGLRLSPRCRRAGRHERQAPYGTQAKAPTSQAPWEAGQWKRRVGGGDRGQDPPGPLPSPGRGQVPPVWGGMGPESPCGCTPGSMAVGGRSTTGLWHASGVPRAPLCNFPLPPPRSLLCAIRKKKKTPFYRVTAPQQAGEEVPKGRQLRREEAAAGGSHGGLRAPQCHVAGPQGKADGGKWDPPAAAGRAASRGTFYWGERDVLRSRPRCCGRREPQGRAGVSCTHSPPPVWGPEPGLGRDGVWGQRWGRRGAVRTRSITGGCWGDVGGPIRGHGGGTGVHRREGWMWTGVLGPPRARRGGGGAHGC